METVLNDLVKDALALNATHASIVEAAKIPFSEEFRKLCEAYGINVMALVKNHGIPYNNGPNTVSYVSLILFKM